MNILWGTIIAVIGLLMFLGGLTKSNFILYKLMVKRSEMLWKENVHNFYIGAGLLVTLFGVLFALGII